MKARAFIPCTYCDTKAVGFIDVTSDEREISAAVCQEHLDLIAGGRAKQAIT